MRIHETWIKLLVRRQKLRLWVDLHAPLCVLCREEFLRPFQLELWPTRRVLTDDLPAAAPVLKAGAERPDDLDVTASWPRMSRRAWHDAYMSRLF